VKPTIGALLGETYDLRLRKDGSVVEIVRVEGVGRLWDRKYMVVPAGSPEGTEPTATSAGALTVYDNVKNEQQSQFGHGRKLSDWLSTFHQNGLDGRGCFQQSSSGMGIGHYTTCGNPAKTKLDAGDAQVQKILPMLAVPHGYALHVYFCGVHDPVKRHAKREARGDARRAEWKRQGEATARREREEKERKRRAEMYDQLVAALAAIVDGEGGDPRELARAALVAAGELNPARTT
jgi:hypothetical protein